jgi:hypothetical protein
MSDGDGAGLITVREGAGDRSEGECP